jgi:hypothetical protein
MPALVRPKPVDVRSMQEWAAFRSRVHELPMEALRARAEELVETLIPDDEARREVFRRQLGEADDKAEFADTFILTVLRLGEITAYISLPPSDNCYALERFSWRTVFKLADVQRAIETGDAPRLLREFESIEHDLAARPLFVRKSEANALLKLKTPSEAELRAIAVALVDGHFQAPLKKAEFLAALLRHCPGCSVHRAGKTWQAYAPAAWRRPGRRRRT